MLHSIILNDQDYEQLLREAIARIPLYTNEWTNFNVSDPGITILQNLTSFSLLQQSLLDEVTDELRQKMLGLLGFHPAQLRAARLLVAPEDHTARTLPVHEKLLLGSLCFETTAQTELIPWSVTGVFAEKDGRIRDLTQPLQYASHASVQIFGSIPQAGDSLTFILSGDLRAGQTLHFYVGAENEQWRNPFDEAQDIAFSRMQWQYYTSSGWTDAACRDDTHGFLTSGGLHLQLGDAAPAWFGALSVQGYAVRCVLSEAEYDIAPRVKLLVGGLFEVEQRDTRAASFVFDGADTIRLRSAMTRYENLFVYCRENVDGLYMAYSPEQAGQTGRFYRRQDEMDGSVVLTFDKTQYGYGPLPASNAVCVVCYDIDTLHRREIGTAYGYEDQTIEMPGFSSVLPEGFSVLAEVRLPNDEVGYRRIEPMDPREDSLCYSVAAAEGALHIRHNGLSGATRLFLCDAATTSGDIGNLRADTRLSSAPEPYFPEETCGPYYIAPGRGIGGRSAESVSALRRRMVSALRQRGSAVSETDYEQVVRRMPGLCIHKVRAVADEQRNLVRITIQCYTEDDRPELPDFYLEQIKRRLDEYRMISTSIVLCQPQYVPINVTAVVRTRNYYENARTEIEQMLREQLDYISTDHTFGETIRFTEIYRQLEIMDCVENVYMLSLQPAPGTAAEMQGEDIVLGESSLCMLGDLTLEINMLLAH